MTELERLLLAALRVLRDSYRRWEESHGPNECAHGIARPIACKKCDMALLTPYLNFEEDIPPPHEWANKPKRATPELDVPRSQQFIPSPFGSRKP